MVGQESEGHEAGRAHGGDGADRRGSPRYPLRLELRVLSRENNVLVLSHTLDISRSGACVRSQRDLPIGSRVEVSFLRGMVRPPLRVEGEVVRRVVGEGRGFAGLGVAFTGLDGERQGELDALIAAHVHARAGKV